MSHYWFTQSLAAVYQLDSSVLGERRKVTLVSLCLDDSLCKEQKTTMTAWLHRRKHLTEESSHELHLGETQPRRTSNTRHPPKCRRTTGRAASRDAAGKPRAHQPRVPQPGVVLTSRSAASRWADGSRGAGWDKPPSFSPTSNHLHLSRTCGRRWTFGEISLVLWHRLCT